MVCRPLESSALGGSGDPRGDLASGEGTREWKQGRRGARRGRDRPPPRWGGWQGAPYWRACRQRPRPTGPTSLEALGKGRSYRVHAIDPPLPPSRSLATSASQRAARFAPFTHSPTAPPSRTFRFSGPRAAPIHRAWTLPPPSHRSPISSLAAHCTSPARRSTRRSHSGCRTFSRRGASACSTTPGRAARATRIAPPHDRQSRRRAPDRVALSSLRRDAAPSPIHATTVVARAAPCRRGPIDHAALGRASVAPRSPPRRSIMVDSEARCGIGGHASRCAISPAPPRDQPATCSGAPGTHGTSPTPAA